jgi:hypothetical protein
VRDLTVDATQETCTIVNEAGELVLVRIVDGEITWRRQFDKPLWAVCYYGDDLLFAERCFSPPDQGGEATTHIANLYRLNVATREIVFRMEYSGNTKRIAVLDNGHVLINGNGDVKATEFDLEAKKVVKQWSAWQLNTCEDVCQLGDHVYTVTYGYQLNTYEYDGKLVDCQFSPDDYPKAVYGSTTANGTPFLMVAGRGAYLSLYAVRDGIPEVAATMYLPADRVATA